MTSDDQQFLDLVSFPFPCLGALADVRASSRPSRRIWRTTAAVSPSTSKSTPMQSRQTFVMLLTRRHGYQTRCDRLPAKLIISSSAPLRHHKVSLPKLPL